MAEEDALKATIDELLKALSARNIIGEPMEMEDKIIIPITKMGMGFGTGLHSKEEKISNLGVAGGAGGGVGVFPVALVIIFKGITGSEGVKVVPLTAPNPIVEPMTNLAQAIVEKLISEKESGEKKPGYVSKIDVE